MGDLFHKLQDIRRIVLVHYWVLPTGYYCAIITVQLEVGHAVTGYHSLFDIMVANWLKCAGIK